MWKIKECLSAATVATCLRVTQH